MVLVMCVRVSVFASNDQYTDGFLYWQNGVVINWKSGTYDLDVLSGYFPASFSSDDFIDSSAESGRFFSLDGKVLPHQSGNYNYSLSTVSQFYVEVLYTVPLPISVLTVEKYDYIDPKVWCQFGLSSPSSTGASFSNAVYAADISQVIDDTLIPLTASGNNYIIPDVGFDVERYWGYRFYFNPLSISSSSSSDLLARLYWVENSVNYTFSEPDYVEGIYNEVTVNTGILQEINGNLTDIKTSTIQISTDISDIKDTVTDTSDQLQNPSSNIWQAAGSTISDAVTGLFVPEQAELDAKMKEVEDIVIDKLGDTYKVIERVDQYEDQLVGGFTGGGRQYNFHFPGISVPLPDGTVTILPEQDVSIENKAFIVFRDLLGAGVALLCGFAAVHIAHDFVICIISGVSYWGFIRGRHNE